MAVIGTTNLWILFAIFIGGGLFGFIGMVTFVPIFTVIYTLIKELVNEKLAKKHLPTDTSEYIGSTPINSVVKTELAVENEVEE